MTHSTCRTHTRTVSVDEFYPKARGWITPALNNEGGGGRGARGLGHTRVSEACCGKTTTHTQASKQASTHSVYKKEGKRLQKDFGAAAAVVVQIVLLARAHARTLALALLVRTCVRVRARKSTWLSCSINSSCISSSSATRCCSMFACVGQ